MQSIAESIDSKKKIENKKILIKDRKWRKRIDETERMTTCMITTEIVLEKDILNSKDKN